MKITIPVMILAIVVLSALVVLQQYQIVVQNEDAASQI